MRANVIVCAVVLLAMLMPGPASGLVQVSITENWQTATDDGAIIFNKSDGEITAVSNDPVAGTGFRWGGWMEVNTKGKYPETRIDWDAKNRDGILSDLCDANLAADGYEPGVHVYTIFSSTGGNIADRFVPNLETVSVENTKGRDWLARLTIRDANGDWYLSSLIDLPGDGVQTINVAALTWYKIIGDTATDMNELDAGGPHAEQLGGSGDGDGPGPLTLAVTDMASNLPDLSKVTGGGFVYGGPAPGPKVWLGPVTWQGFETPPTAYRAFPNAVAVNPWVKLNWKTGEGVVGEKVYFGQSPESMVEVTAVGNLYDPGPLELGKTYYWRVDSQQPNGDMLPPEDGTWSFSVAEFATLDDMDIYTPWDIPDNNMFDVWLDGIGNCVDTGNGTGSTISIPVSTIDPAEVAGSMRYEYDNDGSVKTPCDWPNEEPKEKYSVANANVVDLPSGIGSDWSGVGGKALWLQFYGMANNDANEPMWIKLGDQSGGSGTVIYGQSIYGDEDAGDLREESWHDWIIDLTAFGVDLTQIKDISVGFGQAGATEPGGSGVVYFRSLRFYVSQCIPDRYDLVADLNGDCIVDQADLDIMMEEWLRQVDDMVPLTSGAVITGGYESDDPNRVEFTDDWAGHTDNSDRYKDFYSIADEGGQPVLELFFPEGGYYKFPRVKTADKVDFARTTTATIEWKAKSGDAITLSCVANNRRDPYYRFQFVLYDNGVNQNLGWVPNNDIDADPSDEFPYFDAGPTDLFSCYQYKDLVTGMNPGEYVTLDLTVVVDDSDICTIDYTVTQGAGTVGSGTINPTPHRGADVNKRDWTIGSAYGEPDTPGQRAVGGFVKTCDISNQKGITADIVPDGVIDELDRAKLDEEWLKQDLWP